MPRVSGLTRNSKLATAKTQMGLFQRSGKTATLAGELLQNVENS